MRKKEWMAVNSSVVLYQSQKIFSSWPERENTKIYLHSYSHSLCNPGHMKDPHFPTTIFSCSQGTVKNVTKSTGVFCHASGTVGPGTVGRWLSPCSHQLFSAVTGPESNPALPAPFFVPTMIVCSPDLTEDLANPVAYLCFLLSSM